MRTHVNPFIRVWGRKIGKIKWLKKILQPIKDWYFAKIDANRNQMFLVNGIQVFKELDFLLRKFNIDYSVTYGSLLGTIREKGPIPHDLDFDICLWASDYNQTMQTMLESNGFKLLRRLLVDDGKSGREETYSKNGVDIDFFYIYEDSNYPSYSCCFEPVDECATFEDSIKKFGYIYVRRLQIPISKTLIRLPFGDIEVNVMDNYDEFLRVCYGPSYMIPDPNYKPIDGDNVRFRWTIKKGVIGK